MKFFVADKSRQENLKDKTDMWEFKSKKITQILKEICYQMREHLHTSLLQRNLNKQQDRISADKNCKKNNKTILNFFMSQYKEADNVLCGVILFHG
jgi:phosphotransacetylase